MPRLKTRWLVLVSALVAAAGVPGFSAELDSNDARESIARYFHPIKSSQDDLRKRGLESTGLRPVYPAGAECPQPTSFFADSTRGDGSTRNPRFFRGYHGGLDIPAPEGTPILAIADGAVVAKKEGSDSGIGGIEIVLQHAPADTGFSVWLYSQYKHLKEMPALEIGERVKMGQPIAITGITGTQGYYYKSQGHAHLHLTIFMSRDDGYAARMFFAPPNGEWVDPLAIYRGKPLDTAAVKALAKDAKAVVISYLTDGGTAVTPGKSRVIWPYACKPGGK